MDTRELASSANHLAEEIRRILLHAHDVRHREALGYAEAIAKSLAHELEQSASNWPEAVDSADVASRRSY